MVYITISFFIKFTNNSYGVSRLNHTVKPAKVKHNQQLVVPRYSTILISISQSTTLPN